ncbi:MAG TPA: VWA domain-containing protein [Candidatus Acidoferrales bacterium]|nr:VWA domain-containing protein [Candidatus Acidoferrales bacterium]
MERVNVDAAVTDARGQFVTGLKREHFHVFDNGAEQPIADFSPIEAPARILLVVEASPAVYLLSDEHRTAAFQLLDGLAPGDFVAFGVYDDSFRPIVGFTQNKGVVGQSLAQMQFGLGFARLNLFGSLSSAIADVLATPVPDAGAGGKTAIVLLSTGLSDLQTEAVRQRLSGQLQVSGIAVYTIALGGNLRSPRGKTAGAEAATEAFAQADRDLRAIAESSGGLPFFPKTGKDLAGAYAEVARTLRHLYSVAFVPPAHDGKVHVLRVEVREREGLRILARPAYLAPSE